MPDSNQLDELKDKISTTVAILRWEMGNGWGHVGARTPDQNRFLLRHIRPPLDKRTPADELLEYDLDGNLVNGKRDLPQEIYFYSVPLKEKKNVNVVIHCHPPAAITLTAAGGKILAIHQDAIRFGNGIPVAPWLYGSWPEHGDEAVKIMGDNCALVIEGHGALAFGETIEEACMNMVHLERTAKMILMAKSVGEVKALTPAVIQQYQLAVHGENFDPTKNVNPRNPGKKEWRYFEYMVKTGEQWPRL